jgi:hypothetical protein
MAEKLGDHLVPNSDSDNLPERILLSDISRFPLLETIIKYAVLEYPDKHFFNVTILKLDGSRKTYRIYNNLRNTVPTMPSL